jgi:hypothetical protein
MQIIYHAGDILEANIVAGLLNSHDIPCNINGEYLSGAVGELPTMGLTTIAVEQQWLVQATNLIQQYENGQI